MGNRLSLLCALDARPGAKPGPAKDIVPRLMCSVLTNVQIM